MAYENLKAFVKETFPELQDHITEKQYEQISWIDNNFHTNAPISAPNSASNIIDHQKRIFARLHFLKLITSGTDQAYAAFVAGQPEPRLSRKNFSVLYASIAMLTPRQYAQLWVATTVSKSVHANDLAKNIMRPLTPPVDSVEFLALMMSKYQGLYPAVIELIENDDSASEGFEVMFNSGHFRHMLYVEDGIKMFNKLKAKIQSGEFNQSKLNLWFCYWLIAIAGFRGYTSEKGSVYFTDNTFEAVNNLRYHLHQYLTSTDYPVLENYLTERGKRIGLKELHLGIEVYTPVPELKGIPLAVLSRMAAMLHLFALSKTESNAMKIGLGKLRYDIGIDAYKKLLDTFNPLVEKTEPAITYAPVFFEKLSKAVGFEKTIFYGLLIYTNAFSEYQTLRANKAMDLSIPLNLNNLASEKIIEMIAHTIRFKETYNINIDPATGNASFLISPGLTEKLNAEVADKIKLEQDANELALQQARLLVEKKDADVKAAIAEDKYFNSVMKQVDSAIQGLRNETAAIITNRIALPPVVDNPKIASICRLMDTIEKASINKSDYLEACLSNKNIETVIDVIDFLIGRDLFGKNIEGSETLLSIVLAAEHLQSVIEPMQKAKLITQEGFILLVDAYGDKEPQPKIKKSNNNLTLFTNVSGNRSEDEYNSDTDMKDDLLYDTSSSSNQSPRGKWS